MTKRSDEATKGPGDEGARDEGKTREPHPLADWRSPSSLRRFVASSLESLKANESVTTPED
ncbi:MAG: hypothetical protein ACYTGP_03570 [Planctomycetota bacterium]|jgi:hypothetical protein